MSDSKRQYSNKYFWGKGRNDSVDVYVDHPSTSDKAEALVKASTSDINSPFHLPGLGQIFSCECL